MRSIILLLILLSVARTGHAQATSRFFSDPSGKFRIRASIVDLNETTVKLRKLDGTEIEVLIAKLCEGDQTFLKARYQKYKQMVGDFEIGRKVEIFSTGAWHPGVVKNVQPGKFFISFDHYSSTWDKWVTADQFLNWKTHPCCRLNIRMNGLARVDLYSQPEVPSGNRSAASIPRQKYRTQRLIFGRSASCRSL